jgi:hypothetical protein
LPTPLFRYGWSVIRGVGVGGGLTTIDPMASTGLVSTDIGGAGVAGTTGVGDR